MAVVTFFRFTPRYCNYCSNFPFWWVIFLRSTVTRMYLLCFGWWCDSDVIIIVNDVRQSSPLSLSAIVRVALIGLGGVNFVCLQVSLKFIPSFPMLPNPIPYSELESISLWQYFFFLASCFMIAFLSCSIFLHNCAKDCFVGLGFLASFLVAQKLDFSFLFFSYLQQSCVLCMVCVSECFLHRSRCFSEWAFLGIL